MFNLWRIWGLFEKFRLSIFSSDDIFHVKFFCVRGNCEMGSILLDC